MPRIDVSLKLTQTGRNPNYEGAKVTEANGVQALRLVGHPKSLRQKVSESVIWTRSRYFFGFCVNLCDFYRLALS